MPAFGQKPQIEAKELSYIEDTMKQEALICKKLQHYSGMLTDPTAKDLASQLVNSHRQNFDSLFNYLSSHQ